jgi:hypothetical protein
MKGLEVPGGMLPISEEEVTFLRSETGLGDLSNKFDPPIVNVKTQATLHDTTARRTFDNQIVNHGHVAIWEGGNPEGPSILLLGDSFASGLVEYLAHRARRLVRLHTSSIDREIVFRERPDVVLSVSIERFLRSVPAGMAEFSYKTDLRDKLKALDDDARQRIIAPMRGRQSLANAAYAADVLCSTPLE